MKILKKLVVLSAVALVGQVEASVYQDLGTPFEKYNNNAEGWQERLKNMNNPEAQLKGVTQSNDRSDSEVKKTHLDQFFPGCIPGHGYERVNAALLKQYTAAQAQAEAAQAEANQAVVGVVDQEDPDNSELGQLGIAAGDAYAQAVQAQEDYENIKHAGYADTSDIQALRAVARNKAMEAEFALQMLQNQAAQMPEYAIAVDEKGNNLVSMDSDAAGERGNAIYNAQGSRRQRLSDITNNAVYGVSRQFGRGSDLSDLGQDVRRAKNWTIDISRNAYDATARRLGRAKKSIMSAPRNAYDFTRQRLSNGTSWVSQVPTRVKDGATSAWEKFISLFARNKPQAAQ